MPVKPSIKFLRQCFECDGKSGILIWKNRPSNHFSSEISASRWNGRWAGTVAGNVMKIGYRRVSVMINGKVEHLLEHRIIWAMQSGKWPSKIVDHINNRPKDNRISNLRLATVSKNRMNSIGRRESKVGLKGVTANRTRFDSRIMADGESQYLGSFGSAIEAHQAYRAASVKLHGKFSRSS